MKDLNAMAIFAEVARTGSFSAAADNLSMALSTVSRKVATLENSLNVKLLERTTRRLRLTEIGAQYLVSCRRGLEGFNAANAMVEEIQSEVSGNLRISVPPNLAEDLFVPVIGQFQSRYPKARIQMFVTDRLIDFVKDDVDLSFRVGLFPDSPQVTLKMATYRHILVASPGYIAERGMPDHPSGLRDHRLVGFGFWGKPNLKWSLSGGKQTHDFLFKPHISINDYSALQRAISLGQGVGELPSILCSDALRKRTLVEVLPDWRFPEIDLRAVHTGTKNLPRLARLFLDACKEHVGQTVKKR